MPFVALLVDCSARFDANDQNFIRQTLLNYFIVADWYLGAEQKAAHAAGLGPPPLPQLGVDVQWRDPAHTPHNLVMYFCMNWAHSVCRFIPNFQPPANWSALRGLTTNREHSTIATQTNVTLAYSSRTGSEIYVDNCCGGNLTDVCATVLHETMHNLRWLGQIQLHQDPRYGMGIYEETSACGLQPNRTNLLELGRGLRNTVPQWTHGLQYRSRTPVHP